MNINDAVAGPSVGSNPTGGMEACLLCVVCCQVEVCVTNWSLVQRSPTDCGASLCVIYKPREWSPGPMGAVAPETNYAVNVPGDDEWETRERGSRNRS